MILHNDNAIFRQAVEFTAQEMRILPIYIEKDYWVTYVLKIIFQEKAGDDAVFKGGTALSKCFSLIDRFSEDIDLVVVRHEGETDSKMKSKLRAISDAVKKHLPEKEVDGMTVKRGMNRKTVHEYDKAFKGNFGQVRDTIVLEASWLGHPEPYETKQVKTYIHDMMISRGQESLIPEYGLEPFEVKVLSPKRTICEKIMSLVRFSYSDNPLEDFRKKIRHTYDLHFLLADTGLSSFFDSDDFNEMLLKVAEDDKAGFKNNNEWLINHPKDSRIFKDLDTIWPDLIEVYNKEFRNLVYGRFPGENEVFKSLQTIRKRLNKIIWSLKL